jgi:hypothetical protein
VLFAAYAATAAPGVTFWDSGEFIAAARSWGIPHPPGTPLYVTIARAWTLALGAWPVARAATLLSAAATALAAAALALFVARAMRSAVMGFAAAICAGAMTTAWSSATETEAYATALLLAMGMLLAAERAGRDGSARWLALTAYLMALSVPMHLSALVAAPAAVALVASRENGTFAVRDGVMLTGVFLVAAGVGRASGLIAIVGAVVIMAAGTAGLGARRSALGRGAGVGAAALVALSACFILLLRARQFPALNENEPTTLFAAWEVIGRRQYGDFSLWPRNAPLWLQAVQFLEYADWQAALSLAPRAAPAVARTAVSVLFIALGIVGTLAHRRVERRSWRALAVLFACASAGLMVYLNFFAGYSLGYGIVSESLRHEVRERDYFFVFAFWTWGAWAGVGAVALASRLNTRAAALGVIVAALPLAFNWRAMDRARGAEGGAAELTARALLWGAPSRSVLLTSGDHDTFLLWYAKVAKQDRPDVAVLLWGFLYKDWYRAQIARRDSLVVRSAEEPLKDLASEARRQGRTVAFTFSSDAATRALVGGPWMLRGLTFVPADSSAIRVAAAGLLVDTTAAREFAREFGTPALPPGDAIDGSAGMWLGWIGCPAQYLKAARSRAGADSLASRCKFL